MTTLEALEPRRLMSRMAIDTSYADQGTATVKLPFDEALYRIIQATSQGNLKFSTNNQNNGFFTHAVDPTGKVLQRFDTDADIQVDASGTRSLQAIYTGTTSDDPIDYMMRKANGTIDQNFGVNGWLKGLGGLSLRPDGTLLERNRVRDARGKIIARFPPLLGRYGVTHASPSGEYFRIDTGSYGSTADQHRSAPLTVHNRRGDVIARYPRFIDGPVAFNPAGGMFAFDDAGQFSSTVDRLYYADAKTSWVREIDTDQFSSGDHYVTEMSVDARGGLLLMYDNGRLARLDDNLAIDTSFGHGGYIDLAEYHQTPGFFYHLELAPGGLLYAIEQPRTADNRDLKLPQFGVTRFVFEDLDIGEASATRTGGTLTIQGSALADNIRITRRASDDRLIVQSGNTTQSFAAANITQLNIFGGDGEDTITLGDDVLGASIDAGRGDDFVRGGGGNDAIIAGEGDDLVWGRAGDDRITGGAGDDTLLGDGGRDTLLGEDGDDRLLGDVFYSNLEFAPRAGIDFADFINGGVGYDIAFRDPNDTRRRVNEVI